MESPIRHGSGRDRSALIDRIRRAFESKDLDAFAELFADDATLEEVSNLNPPSHPAVVRGREAILHRLRNETLRDPVSGWARQLVSTTVTDDIETDDGLAFTELRTYAAGDKVIAQHLARKQNGRITRDRVVVVWDAD